MSILILGVSGARGIVGHGLDEGVARDLAVAFGGGLERAGGGEGEIPAPPILVGRDSRPSGPLLAAAVAAALRGAGFAVVDLGLVPTPTVQVAVEEAHAAGGIIITASHNPREWNALKFVGPAGTFLDSASMQGLIARYRTLEEARGVAAAAQPATADHSDTGEGGEAGPLASRAMERTEAGSRALDDHVERILRIVGGDAIRAARLRVVVDAVHGAGFVLIAPLLERLGVSATWIDGEPDGRLPDHPEPRAERLEPLALRVAEARAQVGFALDPDGDRCAVVLPGRVLGEEWTLPLCALHVLERGRSGILVANLSTSARIEWVGAQYGRAVERTPVGEAHVVARMKVRPTALGGEGNGGVIDPQVHYGRDAGVAIGHLLGLEATGPDGRGGILRAANQMPTFVLVKRELALDVGRLPSLERELTSVFGPPAGREDGVRWAWPGRWIQIRPSGTEPIVRLFAEAADRETAEGLVAEVLARCAR
ncbi:MAG: phosphoglucosamine mutase [Candidatus Eisenbacteria bacterium]